MTDGNYTVSNPFFDMDANYTLRGQWNFILPPEGIPLGEVAWHAVFTNMQQIVMQNGYIIRGEGPVLFQLPMVAALGQVFEIVGMNASGWLIQQNSGQLIHLGMTATTPGLSGSIMSSQPFDCIKCICTVPNLEFVVSTCFGNFSVT